MSEIEQALDHHELIKQKIAADRDTRHTIATDICTQMGAESIHTIGQMLVLFRRNEDKPKVVLPSG
jgi:RNA-binding protein